LSRAEAVYEEWIWQTQQDFNILVYGVGDKTELLCNFHKQYLNDEDCVGIDGWPTKRALVTTGSLGTSATEPLTSEEAFRQLLDRIWVDIMGKTLEGVEDIHSHDSLEGYLAEVIAGLYSYYKLTTKEMHGLSSRILTNSTDFPDFGDGNGVSRRTSFPSGATGDEVNTRVQELRQHRLYILAFGLDGPLLSSPTTLYLMSKLAACRVVSIIGNDLNFLKCPFFFLSRNSFSLSQPLYPTSMHLCCGVTICSRDSSGVIIHLAHLSAMIFLHLLKNYIVLKRLR
jgi:hypothetical protein